jgi:hypothetical protein
VEAITTKLRSATVPLASDATVDIVQMILPPGNWSLLGTLWGVWDPAAGSVYFYCNLFVGSSVVDTHITRLGSAPDASLAGSLGMQAVVTVPTTTTARVRCAHDQNITGSLRVENARISAFRVASVTTQTGDGT